MWALVAEIGAADAEAKSMWAANELRVSEGKGLAYGEEHYHELSQKFLAIADKLREL